MFTFYEAAHCSRTDRVRHDISRGPGDFVFVNLAHPWGGLGTPTSGLIGCPSYKSGTTFRLSGPDAHAKVKVSRTDNQPANPIQADTSLAVRCRAGDGTNPTSVHRDRNSDTGVYTFEFAQPVTITPQ